MKIRLIASMIAAISITASAQNLAGTSVEDRIPEADRATVLENISLYRDAYKAKNWAEAYGPWKIAFEKGPLSQSRIYTDGAWMLAQMIQAETDAAKKQQLFDELMNVHDTRLKNLDALNSFATAKTTTTRGNIICRKADDYYRYCPNMDPEVAYKTFEDGIADMGVNEVQAYVLYDYIYCSYNRFKANPEAREDFISDYMTVDEVCENLLAQAREYPTSTELKEMTDSLGNVMKDDEGNVMMDSVVVLDPKAQKIINDYYPTQQKCNELFISSGAADCNELEKIFQTKVEANKNDLAYLEKVLDILSKIECEKSKMYGITADYALKLKPNSTKAVLAKAKTGGASSPAQMEAAINSVSDPATKAKYALSIAASNYKSGNISGCRSWCNKALSYQRSCGKAYLLIASCVVRSAKGDNLERSKYYCLAIDYCNRAKSADPSCAGSANSSIASYSRGLYPKSEAFFAGLKAGQRVSVMGESTVLRFR